MINTEQIKFAKSLGKRLRKIREEQGFNLAILASKLKFSVVEIVAIEDGNLYAFNGSLEKFSESANLYAKEIGAELSKLSNPIEQLTSISAKEWDISVPTFLKKQD